MVNDVLLYFNFFFMTDGTLYWDKPSITGSFDSSYNRFVGPGWGYNYYLQNNKLNQRNFLKNDVLIIFADFEGKMLRVPNVFLTYLENMIQELSRKC